MLILGQNGWVTELAKPSAFRISNGVRRSIHRVLGGAVPCSYGKKPNPLSLKQLIAELHLA